VRIVVAMDSFKGSLTSFQAGNCVKRAALSVCPQTKVDVFPLSDGGEGMVDSILFSAGGKKVEVSVSDPLGNPLNAAYGILPDGTALIEVAAAAGLPLLNPKDRDPMKTTTYGVGQMILDAIQRGCRNFLIGLGGSATNDGGIGMLHALGYEFLDAANAPISLGAIGLQQLKSISTHRVPSVLSQCRFRVACDVSNPLCGPKGCSFVFAPQKGADFRDLSPMDSWLKNYAEITKRVFPEANPEFPGSGAAGGLGFAFLSYLNAVLESGITIVMDAMGLEREISKADLVITGEGRLDGQSLMGKVPTGVSRLAKKYEKRVIALAGSLSSDASLCHEHGIDAYFSILQEITSLSHAMTPSVAETNLESTAKEVFRLLLL